MEKNLENRSSEANTFVSLDKKFETEFNFNSTSIQVKFLNSTIILNNLMNKKRDNVKYS